MNKLLKSLKTELQVYIILVEIDLGGGNHSYLVLVLLDTEYTVTPNIQLFVPLIYSNLLIILATAILIEALELKEQYLECKFLCIECKNIKKVLLRYI